MTLAHAWVMVRGVLEVGRTHADQAKLLPPSCEGRLPMPLKCVDHLGFTVSDVDRSTEWYCEHLGFEPFVRYWRPDIGAEVQVLRHNEVGIRLSLRRFEAGDTEPFNEFRIGLDHIALQVEDEAEIERWRARLEACGIRCDRSDQPALSILVFRDPDNIQIELCTPLQQ